MQVVISLSIGDKRRQTLLITIYYKTATLSQSKSKQTCLPNSNDNYNSFYNDFDHNCKRLPIATTKTSDLEFR